MNYVGKLKITVVFIVQMLPYYNIKNKFSCINDTTKFINI